MSARPSTVTLRRALLALLVLVPVGVAAGWWWSGDGRVERHPGDLVLLVAERSGSGMEAQTYGALAVLDGGCLGLGDVVVVWPHGTDLVSADPVVLDVPGVGRVAEGDTFDLGGGGVYEPSEGPAPDPFEVGGITVPQACGQAAVWLAS